MRNELKQLWYDDYPHQSVLDILDVIKLRIWNREKILSQILELSEDRQIVLSLNSTPCIYPIMRIVDDRPGLFESILSRTSNSEFMNGLIPYVYRAGIKKRELEDLYWIMSELKAHSGGRVRMTWTYLSRKQKFFEREETKE